MKREPQPQGVYRIWPWFFWKYCEKCGMEFRREPGWRLVVGMMQWTHYICAKCIPNAAEAKRWLLDPTSKVTT